VSDAAAELDQLERVVLHLLLDDQTSGVWSERAVAQGGRRRGACPVRAREPTRGRTRPSLQLVRVRDPAGGAVLAARGGRMNPPGAGQRDGVRAYPRPGVGAFPMAGRDAERAYPEIGALGSGPRHGPRPSRRCGSAPETDNRSMMLGLPQTKPPPDVSGLLNSAHRARRLARLRCPAVLARDRHELTDCVVRFHGSASGIDLRCPEVAARSLGRQAWELQA
jgi:hypothetical protein